MKATDIAKKLQALGNKEKARLLLRFFKTGPGQYGEGDVFVGIAVPEIRKLAKEYQGLSVSGMTGLLRSPIHEARLLALFLLIHAFRKGDAAVQERIYTAYLQNTRQVNNWDLVDCSAEHIVGSYLQCQSRAPLYKLAASPLLWERRIAIIATFRFIKSGEFAETLRIADMLLNDREDLMHKAVGWMLREVGKRDRGVEQEFLKTRYKIMPRTMLRYAIEKFPEKLRQQYLRGTIKAQ
jgi:3-methyladenine DNA glycosylase AlkD